MTKKYSELRKGDIIIFNKSSGSASFTTIKEKGSYFTPALKQTRLSGVAIPIKRNEPFIYSGCKLLHAEGTSRTTRIEFTRVKTNQTCYLSEYCMHLYFVKPEDQTKWLEGYR